MNPHAHEVKPNDELVQEIVDKTDPSVYRRIYSGTWGKLRETQFGSAVWNQAREDFKRNP